MNLSELTWTENGTVNLKKSGSRTLYGIADFSPLSNTLRKVSHCALVHPTSTCISKLLCVPFCTFICLPLYSPVRVEQNTLYSQSDPPSPVCSAVVLVSRGILVSPASIKQLFNTPPRSRALPKYKL